VKTIVIAEIGENHLGDLERAKEMVAAAAAAGADYVKFQSYRGADVADDDPEKEWFSRVELSDRDHYVLREHARKNGVEFLSSPFTLERARFLCEGLGLTRIKIASSEMLNCELLDYVNTRAETVFLSTGMSTLEEVDRALSRLGKVPERYVLHCVTQYPAKPGELNLRVIRTLQAVFEDCRAGYSDHSLGIDACLAAVACGARVIEKHFTLDKGLPGTDHVLSVTPEELRELITRIRHLETMLGSPVKQPTPRELAIRESVRGRFAKGAAVRAE
jgi:sialic acid synthase SpsE